MKSFKQYIFEADNESLAAGALFYAEDTGRYGVALRSDECDNPHTWGPVGGSAQDNENPEEACIREVKEEAGITIDPSHLRHIHTFKKAGFQYHTFLYNVPEESEVRPILNSENDDFKWFSLSNPLSPLHPGFEKTLEDLKKAGILK